MDRRGARRSRETRSVDRRNERRAAGESRVAGKGALRRCPAAAFQRRLRGGRHTGRRRSGGHHRRRDGRERDRCRRDRGEQRTVEAALDRQLRNMQKRAWYLGCTSDQVAERVILVGDPGGVPRLSRCLDDVEFLPVNRGLATATGTHRGVRVTLAAFGMGAPIAVIVLHELGELGSRLFLRIGTTMSLPPTAIGDFVIADRALRHEGTSYAYAPKDFTPAAGQHLLNALA